MSGLAVLFHRDGRPVDGMAIDAMLAAISYRGPDGLSARLWDRVALGHAWMVVTPEDQGDLQPLLSPRTGCALIADARLDNREELLAALPDRPPAAASDAEILLRAYEAWGVEAAPRLLGDFAFVLWDPRRRQLVGARDTSGQRTLFYRADARTFAAASEIHQLLQDPAVPMAPNEAAIRDWLVPANAYRNAKDCAATFYEGIHALPAGHVLVVDSERLQVRCYWELQPPAELRFRTDTEYAERYRELLFEAVRARLRSAHPLGVMLSGGLDSSSVACAAQELYRAGRAVDRGFRSFSLAFAGLDCDERDLIEEIQARYGFAAEYVSAAERAGRLQPDPSGFQEAPHLISSSDRDGLWSAACQAGVRVMLTGEIADACVYGSRLVFDSLLRQLHLRSFWRHFQAFRRVSSEPLRTTVAFGCLIPLLPLGVQRPLLATLVAAQTQRRRQRLLPSWMPEPLREELSGRQIALAAAAERGRRFASPAREAEYRLLCPPEITRNPVGWPVQIWRPFADRRLHEFLLAIPPEQKFEPRPDTDEFYAGSKWLVRRALRGILPESVRTRTSKTVFSAAVASEVARQWPAYEAVFGPSATSEIAARGYVDPRLFWSRLELLRDGAPVKDLIYIAHMIGLETWLRVLKLPRPRATQVPIPQPPATTVTREEHAAGPLVFR